jgi:hypothetical protein
MHRNRKAKIVATVGPASTDSATMESMFRAGADVFRLNFSHGTHEDHKQRLDKLRALEQALGRPVGVLLDLQGPKLRIGTFAEGIRRARRRRLLPARPGCHPAGRPQPGGAAASRDLRGAGAGRQAAARRWPHRTAGRTLFDAESRRPPSSTAACCPTARA